MDACKIGARLTALRGTATQKSIAHALGISVSAVAMYESGKRIPRDELKIAIAELYGERVEDIFFHPNDTNCDGVR